MTSGKLLRLERLLDKETKRVVFIPMDDGLLDGPEGGLRNQREKIKQIVDGGANGILGFKSVALRHYDLFNSTGLVLNLTASTSRSCHTRKVLAGSVEEALRLGADAVAVHVNLTSRYEPEMLANLGQVGQECQKWGMPLLGIMYPRGETDDGKDNNYIDMKTEKPEEYASLVRHAARVGVELGADIIKTQYTGSAETFQTVVESCSPVPVIMAGGPKVSDEKILSNIYNSIKAGGSGICTGRNGFNRENTTAFVRAARGIVHQGKNVEEVLEYLK
jgi:predicted phospho-2-dehydro-3-deoxyheptonate aldolase